jgi:hypothetical protein
VRAKTNNQGEVSIWAHPWDTARDDLAIPLSDCGSGIPHILAMLYVVEALKNQIILIDEPQSFLHSSSIRRLVEIFRSSGHQFILTTHSTAILSAADVKTITLVKQTEGISTVEQLDVRQAAHMRACLAELGVSLSEVFGADNILWLEGKTEEMCFPDILQRLGVKLPLGTLIKAVVATGDLHGKDAARIFEIYHRLSGGPSLLPPAIGFLFDDELRPEQAKKEMRHRGGDRVGFLPRRMYENYLLHPRAIASIINSFDGSRTDAVTEEDVQEWLQESGHQPQFGSPGNPDQSWEQYIDASKLLKCLFAELSEQRISYEKPFHSVELTKWLLDTEPETLREVADLIADILRSGEARGY